MVTQVLDNAGIAFMLLLIVMSVLGYMEVRYSGVIRVPKWLDRVAQVGMGLAIVLAFISLVSRLL